jgi:hypothetical protein
MKELIAAAASLGARACPQSSLMLIFGIGAAGPLVALGSLSRIGSRRSAGGS